MKKIKLLLFTIGVFALIVIPKVQALTTFYYNIDSNKYEAADNSGTNDLNSAFIQGLILARNTCITPATVIIPSGVGKKEACETFGGSWFPYGGNINYGSCKIVRKDVCENKGGTFYPTVVTTTGDIDIDTTINYILIAYNGAININAKVTFSGAGSLGGTIGENGKIVISDTGKIEYSDLSKKLYGNTSEYDISVGNGSSVTYKTLAPNGEVFPVGATYSPATDVPEFLSIISTTSDYMELDGDFKLNNPFTLKNYPSSYGSRLVLNDNSTLDLLSDLTIDSGAKFITRSNSKLFNSSNLIVNGTLDINGEFMNGYKLDNSNNPTMTNTGTVTIGSTGKITLFGNATRTNNSLNDIPVTLISGNSGDSPIESVIQGNGPRTITINSSITNGTVTSSKTSATNGEEISLIITPNNGYKVKSISVLDKFDEQPVTVTNNKFVMPSYNVYVNVLFELDIENPQTGDEIMNTILLGSISLIGLLGTSIYFKKRFN